MVEVLLGRLGCINIFDVREDIGAVQQFQRQIQLSHAVLGQGLLGKYDGRRFFAGRLFPALVSHIGAKPAPKGAHQLIVIEDGGAVLNPPAFQAIGVNYILDHTGGRSY